MGVRIRRGRWLGVVAVAALLMAAMPLSAVQPLSAALAADLFFSEYVEGSSFNKAVEIYNSTGAAVDLSTYSVELYSNGSATPSQTMILAGTLADGDVYVIANASAGATVLAAADTTNSAVMNFNGDDALALRKSGVLLDSIGQIGVDPGTEWGTGLTNTLDNTLRRKVDVCAGDTNGSDAFDPAVEWDGYAQDTFDGLGSHTSNCVGELEPKINEFSASTTGTDVEYVEIYGEPDTDLSAYTVLEIEGDAGSYTGVITEVIAIGTTDANGFYLADLPANSLQNNTLTLLLVENFTGALNDDIDTDDDGVIDDPAPWDAIVDSVAVTDGGVSDLTYGVPVLGPNYDGVSSFAPGGASRIPDGFDTEATTDWVRNDFDLAGIPTYPGTIMEGEAYNTPGATNVAYTPPPEACGDPFTPIYRVQGNGAASPFVATEVAVEGIVVGDFQNNGSLDNGDLNGFHLQDPTGDTDPLTSDGVFIYYPSGTTDVAVGDAVRVRGTVSEYHGTTQITVSAIWSCSIGNTLPAETQLQLPVTALTDFEAFEGMRVTFPQTLVISEYYRYDQYNEIVLTSARQNQPSAVYDPGTPEAAALAQANLLDRVTLDDGRTASNPSTVIHPSGDVFTMTNLFRGGDTVANVTGILDQYDTVYRVQPTQGADYTAVNVRPVAPDAVGGDVTVASLNVLNYFTTIDDSGAICGPDANLPCRGADTVEELTRQRAKLVAALAGIDADVVGLIEIENNATDYPTADLVNALNAFVGAGTYDYIATGAIGTDAIRQALIYKPAVVTPVGAFAILDSTVDARFVDTLNRPALAQAFQDKGTGGVFTVAVNHLKSKGSACPDDPAILDESGQCNVARTAAAEALVDWLATDPTGSGDADALIIGDLNSYDKEDPIDAILAGGYTDLIFHFQGEYAYSYVYDSQIGYLDHALASATLTPQVTGTTIWHINADEPDLIDYDMTYKPPAQELLYAPDAYRSSDHDATIVGLNLMARRVWMPIIVNGYTP